MEKLKFKKPTNWKIIRPEHYKDFSIISNDLTPCEYGFAIENGSGSFDVVSVFNYGKVSSTFLKELKEQLDKYAENNSNVSDLNKYIEENAEGYAVKKTNSIKPLFYKKGKLFEKPCFISIMKIDTNVSISYSLQIFFEKDGNMYCFTTTSDKLDEKKPFDSLMKKNQYVDELINVVIKSSI